MSVERDLAIVLKNFDRVTEEMFMLANNAANEIADHLVETARANHDWNPVTGLTDITTEAGIVDEEEGEYIEVALTAGTEWAEFLELARQGRFAWLWPAVDGSREAIMHILKLHLGQVRI